MRPEKLILVPFFVLKISDLNVDWFFILYIRNHHFINNNNYIQWIGLIFLPEKELGWNKLSVVRLFYIQLFVHRKFTGKQ